MFPSLRCAAYASKVVLPIRDENHAVRGTAHSVYSNGGTITTAMGDFAPWFTVVVFAVNRHMPFNPGSESSEMAYFFPQMGQIAEALRVGSIGERCLTFGRVVVPGSFLVLEAER